MFLTQLDALVKLVVILGLVGAGGWLAWPKMGHPKPNPSPRLTARTEQAAPAAREPAVPQKEDSRFQMTGFVRVEGTGEPVEGAKVQVELGMKDLQYEFREALTDTDGHYTIALPEGSARALAPEPPSGYWLPEPGKNSEFFVVTPQQPVYRKDYRVRRGTAWTFRLTEGPKQEPVRSGMVASYAIPGEFSIRVRSETDDKGLAIVTLPGEAGKLTLSLSRKTGNEAMRLVKLNWDQGFRPESIKAVKRLAEPGQPVRFRLTDDAGQFATISGPAEPAITEGRLVVNTSLPERTLESTGTLTGTVVDKDGHPVADAHVTICYSYRQGGAMSGQPEHRVRSDARGQYVLRAIPLQSYEGDPTKLSLVVYKDGYAGVDSGIRVFQPGVHGTQVVDPIRLQPGTSLSGIVLDPNGLPVMGAEIRPTGSWAQSAWTYRSGPDGRFTIPNLRKGVVFVDITFGKFTGAGRYIVDGKGEVLKVQLRSAPKAKLAAPVAKPIPPNPLNVGQLAPKWVVRGWTDGKERSLADFRGKVIFLEFWGIWCGPCVASLPVVEELRRKYEPQGVVFLSIHTPGEPLDKIRKLYDVKKVSLISALDEGPEDDVASGTTARAYGVGGYPTNVLIDKTGKIAYRSTDPANRLAVEALVKKLGIDTNAQTQEKFNPLLEVLFGEAIGKVLAQP